MAAYIIVDVEINNHEDYEEYKKLTPASVEAYDGTFKSGAVQLKYWKVIVSLAGL